MTSGEPTPLACKQAGMTPQTHYRRRKERCELKMEQAKLMKHLEKENTRLWRLVAELSLEKQVLKDVAEGNFEALEGDFGDQYHHFLAATTRSPLMPPRHRVAILEETAATRWRSLVAAFFKMEPSFRTSAIRIPAGPLLPILSSPFPSRASQSQNATGFEITLRLVDSSSRNCL